VQGLQKRAAVPMSSWPLVLVLGRRHIRLGPIGREAPALLVGKLVAKDGHRQVGHLDAACRALPGFFADASAKLGDDKSRFQSEPIIPFHSQVQWLTGRR
jgi:hypothetical protein